MLDKNKYSTVALKHSVLEDLKNSEVLHHWINMWSNSDKVQALLLFYKENS